MAWVHIEDNAKAWELYQAGLLWFGTGPDDMTAYPFHDPALFGAWTLHNWSNTRFDGTDGKPNYIFVED